jgi:AcrR family transcriptional regulator
MRSRNSRIRSDARADAEPSGAEAEGAPGADLDGGEDVRRRILEATIACFVDYGWGGTNMSVIARRAQLTRGRIQYYFPTLDALLRAAVRHLNDEWRRQYFTVLNEIADAPQRFYRAIDELWRLMHHPLHVAKRELEASARTNPELAAIMQEAAELSDGMTLGATREAFPRLASAGDAPLRAARDFALIFLEGLSLFRFGSDAEARRAEQLAVLTGFLVAYWRARGIEVGAAPPGSPEPALRSVPVAPLASLPPDAATPSVEAARERALRLILEAAAALSEPAP